MSNYCRVCFCLENFLSDKDGDEEYSHCLLNWEKWLERRERICKNLSKNLERPPESLLLNYAEEYRKIQEERLQIEYANINTYFDKYRGNPEFWTQPYGLTQRCKGCNRKCDPVYFAQKTKPQRNEVPNIDYVGVPDIVLQQKHLTPRTRSIWTTWQKSSYRAEKLKKLQPNTISHIPQTEQLAVQGQSLSKPSVSDEIEEPELVPKEDLFITSNLETKNVFEMKSVPRIAFEINDMYFSDNIPFDTKTLTLNFELEGKDKEDCHNFLRFNNKGKVVLRIHWKRFVGEDDIDKIMDKQKLPGFLFDDSEILLCPRAMHQLPVWFVPTEYGGYHDCWEITTVPKLPWGQILVELEGALTIKNFIEKSQAIKDLLDHKVTVTMVKGILNSIIDWVTTEPSQEKLYRFTKKQLFESNNLEYCGVERRLKYAYDEKVVRNLERFYYAIKEPGDPEIWNCSVNELGTLARRRDIIDFARYQTKLITSIRVFTRSKKSLEHQFVFGSNYRYFTELRDQLVTPLMVPFSDREKYLAAFFALRVHFWKMCRDLDCYDDKKNYYPSYRFDQVSDLDDLADRLVQEKFQDIWLDRLKRGLCEVSMTGAPKSHRMKSAPSGDKQALHNKVNTAGVSKKIKVSKVDGTSVRSSSGSVRRNQNFNPLYDERFENVASVATESSITTVQSLITPTIKINPDYYTTYIIVYTHLCNAIDGIVAAIETPSMKYNTFTLEEIHELWEGNVIKTETPPPSEEASENAEEYEGDYSDEADEGAIEYVRSLLENTNIQKYLIEGHLKDDTSDTCVIKETTPLDELDFIFYKSEGAVEVPPLQECGIQTENSLNPASFSDLQLNRQPLEGSETSFGKLSRTPQSSSQKLRNIEGSRSKLANEFFYIQDYPGDECNEN